MAETWEHPDLGRFVLDGGEGWRGTVAAPGFDVFAFDVGYDVGPPDGRYELVFRRGGDFGAEDDADAPSEAEVAVARRVLADPAGLARTVAAALWDDFDGRGPGSGMWWQGDLAAVAEAMEGDEAPPPAGPDDVARLLRLGSIVIRESDDRPGKPVADLAFWASFEEEHGVGVLTDGETVLGLGYQSDAEPFGRAGAEEE